jgi:hypothetical protein
MTTLIVAANAAELAAKRNAAAAGVRGPMPQQAASGSHGYEMQKFVRLVGCHQSKATKCDVLQPMQRTAA